MKNKIDLYHLLLIAVGFTTIIWGCLILEELVPVWRIEKICALCVMNFGLNVLLYADFYAFKNEMVNTDGNKDEN